MRVRNGERTFLDARAKAEAADAVTTPDYYTQLPQIRLTANSVHHPTQAETTMDVTLDGNDVAALVECAIRHPAPNMRYAVLAAIWNHPDSLRQIFQFGLTAPPAYGEIRQIVAEELDKRLQMPERAAAKPAGDALLPRMPLPAHLRHRERQ